MAGVTNPSLYQYQLDTQLLLADTSQTYFNLEDLTRYINRARREVAMRTQSLRVLSPVSGAITSIEVVNPGAGYAAPVVVIDPPDMPSGAAPYPGGAQATANAQQIGGQISNVSVEFGGDGYFNPRVRIEDEFGTGAEVRVHTVPLTTTQEKQEVYVLNNAVPLERFPGVGEIFAVKSINFIYANYRYSIPVFSFTNYQAYIRIYPQQYLYVPTAAAQFGQGTNISLYMYPIPSALYQFELDLFCLPQDLETDQDFEAIPKPWTDAVSYFAAHLCYLGLQNHNAAQYFLNLYDDMVRRYSAYARPGRATNPYGRWAAFT